TWRHLAADPNSRNRVHRRSLHSATHRATNLVPHSELSPPDRQSDPGGLLTHHHRAAAPAQTSTKTTNAPSAHGWSEVAAIGRAAPGVSTAGAVATATGRLSAASPRPRVASPPEFYANSGGATPLPSSSTGSEAQWAPGSPVTE